MSLGRILREAFQAPALGSIQSLLLTEAGLRPWPDVTLSALFTRHPGPTLAFRVEHKGRVLVYCPDNEPEDSEDTQTDFPEKLSRFVRGADLLIHDARWLDEDYDRHRGEGHACPHLALELAKNEGVRRLVLFHLDSSYGASDLELLGGTLRRRLREEFSSLELDVAAAGMSIGV